MFCSYCGKEIADDTVYCPHCGRKLGGDSAPAEEAPVEAAPADAPAAIATESEAPVTMAPEAAPTAPEPVPAPAAAAPMPAPVEPAAAPAPAAAPVEAAAAVQPVVSGEAPMPPVATRDAGQVQPAMTAPMPQPVQTPPAMLGTAPQPVYGQAPVDAYYDPTGATSAPKKKSAVPWIIALTVAAIALVFVISRCTGGSGSGSSGSGSGGGTAPAAVSGEALDANGNPTLHAFLELDGPAIGAALEDQGFAWEDGKLWWKSDDANDAVWVSGPNEYEFEKDEILGLDVNGAGTPTIFAMAVDDRDYSSVENVMEAIGNVDFVDDYWIDSDACAAVVESSTGRRNVVICYHDTEDELYRTHVVNPEGIERGVLEEFLGERGTTLEDIWYAYTGKRLNEPAAPAAEPEPSEPSPSEGTHTDPSAAASVPQGALKAGSYAVGQDIPAGEYKLYSTDEWGGYYTVYSKVGSTSYDDIVAIDSFDTCMYITVFDGQELEVEGAEFIAIDQAEPSTEWTGDGMYKVGFDIPAGQYQLVADDSEWGSYVEVRNSVEAVDDYYGASVSFDSFENNKYVTLSDGQYVSITNCHVEQ